MSTVAPTPAAAHGQTLTSDLVGEILVVTIDQPNEPVNTLSPALATEFEEIFVRVTGDLLVKGLVLISGKPDGFIAGADIEQFSELRSAEDAERFSRLGQDMLDRLEKLRVPTVAAIHGACLGGGLELALACDLRVCKKGVKLGFTESRLGGLAGNGAVRVTHLVGPARAKELLFTGEVITTDQALAWGLVNRVVESGSALEGARELAHSVVARGPVSNRLAKRLVDAAQDTSLDAALSMSTVAQQQIFDSEDLHEGVSAFLSKRAPNFQGR